MPLKLIPVLVSASGEWDAVVSLLQPPSLQQSLPGAHFQTELAGQPCLFSIPDGAKSPPQPQHNTSSIIINRR